MDSADVQLGIEIDDDGVSQRLGAFLAGALRTST
jgi:hypothetical protein